MSRVYTAMVADLFHPGHVAFLRAARQIGSHLSVYLLPDDVVQYHKGKRPVMTQAERVEVVMSCRFVDAVLTVAPLETTLSFMRQHGFDIYTFACATPRERLQKYALCRTLPASMIRELSYTAGISSSEILGRMVR